MSYFKYGDVVFCHDREPFSGRYRLEGEWVVIDVRDDILSGKNGPVPSSLVTVTNQRERFSCDEQFLTLVRPTPEERVQEKLGEDYL